METCGEAGTPADTGVPAADPSDPVASVTEVPETGEWAARFKGFMVPSVSQLVVAIAVALLLAGTIWQVKSSRLDETYSRYRRSDLIQALDQLESESRRLSEEIRELDETKRQLLTGIDSVKVARQETQKRLDTLGVLAGTIPVRGEGIRVTIDADPARLSYFTIMDAISELRDAGAEAIELNDGLRVVAQSWFSQDDNGLVVDGQLVQFPLVIDAIGNSHSLEEGLRFRGGLVSQIESDRVGGSVAITRSDSIEILSVRYPERIEYGKPR